MRLHSLIQKTLGWELALPVWQRLARRFPGNRGVQRLCWHAGEGVRNKYVVRKVVTTHGFSVAIDLSDHTWRHLYFFGDYEPEVTAIVARLAAPGQVWWDIGANIGWFTLHLSRIVKATGKVVAFEPNPFTAKLLQRALKDSVSTNVLFCELALGDGSASAILHVPLDVEHTDGGYGRPSLIRQSDIADYAEVTVSVSSADEQIQRGTPIPFGIKMDVEGFESAVLAGATHLFKQSPPSVILCEATHRPDVLVQPVELVQSIRNFGYRAYHVENLREYDPTVPLDGSWSKDFVFLHHRVAETLLPRLLGHEAGSKVERPTSNRP